MIDLDEIHGPENIVLDFRIDKIVQCGVDARTEEFLGILESCNIVFASGKWGWRESALGWICWVDIIPGDFTFEEALLISLDFGCAHFAEVGKEVDEQGRVCAMGISNRDELEDRVESHFAERAEDFTAPSNDANFGVSGEAFFSGETIAEVRFVITSVLELLRTVTLGGDGFGLGEIV